MTNSTMAEESRDSGLTQFQNKLLEFTGQLFRGMGFKIDAEFSSVEGMHYLNLSGHDTEALLANHSEVLLAVEYLLNKIFQSDVNQYGMINCDVLGKKQTRMTELQLIARTAAEKVRKTKIPFRLNPMDSRERRIVHLALAEDKTIRTESEGEGEYRRVVIYPGA